MYVYRFEVSRCLVVSIRIGKEYKKCRLSSANDFSYQIKDQILELQLSVRITSSRIVILINVLLSTLNSWTPKRYSFYLII